MGNGVAPDYTTYRVLQAEFALLDDVIKLIGDFATEEDQLEDSLQ